MRALVLKDVQGSKTALRFLSKMPSKPRDGSSMISFASFCAGVPELAVLARLFNPALYAEPVRTATG